MHGIGSRYYGKCQLREDDSHITTEWFVFFYLPIIPLGSVRVIRDPGEDRTMLGFHVFGYDLLEKLPLHWPQVGRVYLFVGSVALWYWWLFDRGLEAMGFFYGKDTPLKACFFFSLFLGPWLGLLLLRWLEARKARSGAA